MTAYYNEIEPYAAQWLRNLIAAGHIADGVVDERSIEDIHPRDLDGFTQCHFFAGIGVWSRALRRAGWADDRPVWTGSCPCQPFSAAGQGTGFADERHLWPAFFHLISECRPPVVIGEQVASRDAEPWLDLVQDDMEGLGHAFGAVAFPAAGVRAPHIRDRSFWMAHAQRADIRGGRSGAVDRAARGVPEAHGQRQRLRADTGSGGATVVERLADANREVGGRAPRSTVGDGRASAPCGGAPEPGRHGGDRDAGAHHSFWGAADWLFCRDGRWRPVEPGTFPLAHGVAARVGRLRAYGNAIVAPQAQAWIESVMGCLQ